MLSIQEQIQINQLHREQVDALLQNLLAPVLRSKSCQYELSSGGWLTVEYKAPLNNQPEQDDYKYYHIFSANIFEMTLKQIQDKLIIMLFEHLRSLR